MKRIFVSRASLVRVLDDAIDVINQQGRELDEAKAEIAVKDSTIRVLRNDLALSRRQALALDAQLDHMTRVNQALDAGITTTTPQERA